MWTGNSNGSGGLFPSTNDNNSSYGTFNGSGGLHFNSSQSTPSLVNNEDRSRTNLIINYLPQRFDQHDLHNLFEQIGPIRQCKLIRDRVTGASLCYGFVDYMEPENAQKAINTFHGYEIEGKRLRVAYACSGGRRGATNNNNNSRSNNRSPCENVIGWELYIFGVPSNSNDSEIMRNCREFGNVLMFKEMSIQDIWQVLLPQSFCGIEISTDTYERLRSAAIQPNCRNVIVIFEDKKSCESLSQKLSGSYNRDSSRVVCFVGNPVSREAGMLLLSQNQSTNTIPALRNNNALSNTINEGLASLNLSGPVASELKVPLRVQLPEIAERSNAMSSQTSSFGARLHSSGGFFGESTQFSDPMSNFDQRCARPEMLFPSVSVPNDSFPRNFADSPFCHSDLNIWSNGASPLLASDPRRLITPQQSSYIVTPVVKSTSLTNAFRDSGGSGAVEIKLENLQPSGSVTMRVMDYIVKLIAEQNSKINIVVPSTGNAGVSAAVAASHYKMGCTVVVPETDNHTKARLELDAPHARLITFGSTFEEAANKAEQIVTTTNASVPGFANIPSTLLNVYSFTDAHVGYMSLIDELATPPDVIVLPLGGGILMCGVLNRLNLRGWHSTHVVGVEPENIQRYSSSFNEFRQIAPAPGSTTVASNLNVGAPALKWLYVRVTSPTTASIVTVTEAEIVDSTRRLAEECGLLLDPISAVAAAAIYNGALARVQKQKQLPQNLKVLLLITGGRNISVKELTEMGATVARNDVQHQQQSEHCNDSTQNHQPFYLKTVDDLCNDDDDDEKERVLAPTTPSPDIISSAENGEADFESVDRGNTNKDENGPNSNEG